MCVGSQLDMANKRVQEDTSAVWGLDDDEQSDISAEDDTVTSQQPGNHHSSQIPDKKIPNS